MTAEAADGAGGGRRARLARVAAHDPLAAPQRAAGGERRGSARGAAHEPGRADDARPQHARHEGRRPDARGAQRVPAGRDHRDHRLRHARERHLRDPLRDLRLPPEALRRGAGDGRGDARALAPARAHAAVVVPRGAGRGGRQGARRARHPRRTSSGARSCAAGSAGSSASAAPRASRAAERRSIRRARSSSSRCSPRRSRPRIASCAGTRAASRSTPGCWRTGCACPPRITNTFALRPSCTISARSASRPTCCCAPAPSTRTSATWSSSIPRSARGCSSRSTSRRRSPLAIRHHHEWWDGSGYPDGLSGEDIPLSARIIGVADAFDAMSCDRPYRRALDAAGDHRRVPALRAAASSTRISPRRSLLLLETGVWDVDPQLLAESVGRKRAPASPRRRLTRARAPDFRGVLRGPPGECPGAPARHPGAGGPARCYSWTHHVRNRNDRAAGDLRDRAGRARSQEAAGARALARPGLAEFRRASSDLHREFLDVSKDEPRAALARRRPRQPPRRPPRAPPAAAAAPPSLPRRRVDDKKLPLTDHLAELRTRLIRVGLAWGVGSALAWTWKRADLRAAARARRRTRSAPTAASSRRSRPRRSSSPTSSAPCSRASCSRCR